MSRRLLWEIGAERAADLDRADWPPRARAAAEILDELADSRAEGEFDEAAALMLPASWNGCDAARAPDAVFRVGLAAVLEDPRRRGEAQHIVDDGRLAEQALRSPAAAAWRGPGRACPPGSPSSEVSSPQI